MKEQDSPANGSIVSEMAKHVTTRGLWIGLLADDCPAHSMMCVEVGHRNGLNFVLNTKPPHITLAHLGRSNGLKELNATLASAELVSGMTKPRDVSVEALLRMNGHLAVAVETSWIDITSARLDAALADRHVRRDRRFAGLRHVTLGELIDRRQPAVLPQPMKYSLHFAKVIVVCGDVTQEYRLGVT